MISVVIADNSDRAAVLDCKTQWVKGFIALEHSSSQWVPLNYLHLDYLQVKHSTLLKLTATLRLCLLQLRAEGNTQM